MTPEGQNVFEVFYEDLVGLTDTWNNRISYSYVVQWNKPFKYWHIRGTQENRVAFCHGLTPVGN